MMTTRLVDAVKIVIVGLVLFGWAQRTPAAEPFSLGPPLLSTGDSDPSSSRLRPLDDWLTVAANSDFSFRKTQFFEKGHDTSFLQWDGRVELWLPPYRHNFPWGPYVRGAGVLSNRDVAFENAWLAGPGVGIQAYPFSLFKDSSSALARELGPVRLFAEYNRLDFWGSENAWRPDEQVRAGAEYFRAINVNDSRHPWWLEGYALLTFQSANEFDPHYNSVIFAQALRTGLRIPDAGPLSWVTPYVAVESSLTDNPAYAFENRLLVGGGIRIDPDLKDILPSELSWITRFVIFGEYLHASAYYRDEAPSGTPSYDWRVGISISIGDFYK